ncbi:carbohydrate ABC transporter permease [Streptomyces mayteni]
MSGTETASPPRPAPRAATGPAPRTGRRRGPTGTRAPYLFLTPSLVLFGVFSLFPIVAAVLMSTQQGAVLGQTDYVGGDNYRRMVDDPLFWTALENTLVFTAATVPLSMAIGLLLALMLNRPMPGRALLRTVFFTPMVASGVGVGMVMAWIFNGDYGVLNNALAAAGLPRGEWLTSSDMGMVTVVLAVLWTRVGFCMVLYLAALQSIPHSLLEAASLDGAGPWQRFRHVVVPQLSPTTFFLLVVNVVFSLQAFDLLYVLTGGGPGFATTVLIQYIYRSAFANGEMGYASALGVVSTLLLITFTLLRWYLGRNDEDNR